MKLNNTCLFRETTHLLVQGNKLWIDDALNPYKRAYLIIISHNQMLVVLYTPNNRYSHTVHDPQAQNVHTKASVL